MTASGFLWDNTRTAAPITRESFVRGMEALRDFKTPLEPRHIVHPRYHEGKWTRCQCGYWHRLKNGVHETAPDFEIRTGRAIWPDGFFDGEDA